MMSSGFLETFSKSNAFFIIYYYPEFFKVTVLSDQHDRHHQAVQNQKPGGNDHE